MARILIDARSLADATGGGIPRVARIWIKQQTTETNDVKRITNNDDPLGQKTWDAGRATPDEFACVTTGMKPSAIVKDFCEQNNLKYLHLRIPNKLWTLGCLLGIASLTRSAERRIGKIDKVLLPNLGFTGKLYRPYDLLLHDLSFLLEPRWFSWKRRLWHKLMPVKRLIRQADHLDCVSERTRRDAIRLCGADANRTSRFVFDPTLPETEAQRPAWLSPNVNRFILMLGGSDARKNTGTALAAISAYNFTNPEKYLVPVVLGAKKCPTHGQTSLPCIVNKNTVTDNELAYLYKHAAALLYPSWYEGFGLPLHEARAFGTPCVASTAGALPETAPPDTLFCNPAKPHEWLAAIELICNKT